MKENNNSRRDAQKRLRMILVLVIVTSCFMVLQRSGSADKIDRNEMDDSVRVIGKDKEDRVEDVGGINEHVEIAPIIDKSKASESDNRSHQDLKHQKGCNAMKIRPVHDEETWGIFRKTYHSVVGEDLSTIGDHLSTDNAFRFKVSARQSPGKGRGIFAEEEIPKGEILYNFSRTAQFKTGAAFRNFLDKLPDTLACDVLMWSYVQNFPSNLRGSSNLRICTDLDPGSFCNDGGHSEGNMAWEDDNKAYYPATNTQGVKISAPLIALRNIAIDEEILCKYGQFSEGDWGAFGL